MCGNSLIVCLFCTFVHGKKDKYLYTSGGLGKHNCEFEEVFIKILFYIYLHVFINSFPEPNNQG